MSASDLWDYIGITPVGALSVALAAAVLYGAFVFATRLLGQRVLAGLSGFDLVVVMIFGAVLGRATLGPWPTLTGGLVALVTLLALEAVVGQVRRRPLWNALINNQPAVLMAGPVVLDDQLEKYHITRDELHAALRRTGVRHPGEVAVVVLEATGTLSVLRTGEPVDPALLADVRGAGRVPPELLSR
ncbi:uncharacterized membrane protein YcaP (DUF421 family) [Georgenia soli]|uniref:Uncharacterized membrane protein YcaP (DUF421 family) n=1 Tax=Georgenia soli TaxID=638953 RepID=A0A2A9EL70_9MICO|nr:YetF domain-containing protein [Georgenia soli]PFG39837.1 uncharacterized membrane protein YcaP (DUF421 family) [Georgenia soli]